ncbi:molecular chaperone MKKS-like [Mytilus trossulus]|uniref:molecular chaperone MKKS-like n=1 Tax=Mytilus trossulus TaxID=6551 RepID=UPI00300649B5
MDQSVGTLQLQNLVSPDIVDALNLFLKITASCRKGCIQMVQNSVGGHLTMTSTSCRLLQSLSVSKPVIRLIVTAVQGHLQHFSDGGHFVSMLPVLLLTKSMNLNVTNSYLTELYDRFLTIVVEDITAESSKMNIDISSLNQMTNFVKTIIGRKPLCKLNSYDLDNFSKLLVQVFASYLPCEGRSGSWEENIYLIPVEGLPVSDSKLYQGLLLQGYQLPLAALNNVKKVNNRINVAMVTISMTGDSEEIMDAEYEVFNELSEEKTVLSRIMKFCDRCAELNVGVLFCQKVIHPSVKSYLYKQNILPVERLGSQMIPFILKLTGAQSLRSFTVIASDIGHLDSIEHQNINKKSYLSLKRQESPVGTLRLTSDHEESVQELKAVCSSALHSMERLAFSSYVLPGGGCWEMKTCFNLRKKVLSEMPSLVEEFYCTRSAILSALDVVCKSLQNIAKTVVKDSEDGKTDCTYHHFWKVPKEVEEGEVICSCGIYSLETTELVDLDNEDLGNPVNTKLQEDYNTSVMKRTIVIDQLDMCVNSVNTSLLTANALLTTNLFICDS